MKNYLELDVFEQETRYQQITKENRLYFKSNLIHIKKVILAKLEKLSPNITSKSPNMFFFQKRFGRRRAADAIVVEKDENDEDIPVTSRKYVVRTKKNVITNLIRDST